MRYLLHDIFTQTVERFPDKVAIVTENGLKMSYKDLDDLSSKFANYLIKLKKFNVLNNPYVGIISPVHERSIAAIIGVLKIGGVYVPLDEFSPSERLNHIIDTTKLNVLIVDENWYLKHLPLLDNPNIDSIIIMGALSHDYTLCNKVILYTEVLAESKKAKFPILNQVSDDLAYVLHTSGSTGIPKGIMLTHRNARTFVDWMDKEFGLTCEDVIMSRAPLKFDLSVFDIFNTFKVGATLVCFDWNKVRDENKKHVDFVTLMFKEKVTILYTTPSTLIALMNRGEISMINSTLKLIMYAGEPFPTPQLRKLRDILPKTKIANIYGPTETNIITYYWVNSLPENDSPIPLGNVVDDTEILIVSDNPFRICEAGEMGEIWCRGGTVTKGYLGMEEKTKEHLVASPFHRYPAYFWRTGDYGLRDSEGVLHYRGRKDHMVKVKGFRIEIGEVESAVASFENIDEFVVVAVQDEKYGNKLYCFYTLLKEIDLGNLISHLRDKLPDYMIPFKFVQKDFLPKTSSGKVDRVILIDEIKNSLL